MATAGNNFQDIRAKLDANEPLSLEDGVRLYESPDIHTLGELANMVRERLHGRVVYYNINRHINYSNYCILRCKFCAFYRPYPKEKQSHDREGADQQTTDTLKSRSLESPRGHASDKHASEYVDDAGGYEFTIDEIVAQAQEAYARGATEVHIVGGLHPKLPFSYYTDMCSAIRDACPHMHIKAFTAIEIIHFTRISKPRLGIEEVLVKLSDAGLGSMPGGGAEIFDDRVHDEAFKTKVGEAEWFDVHRAAHSLGIFTNATMLYGHVETHAERIQHLIKLREHQEHSLHAGEAHFNCVIPLSFIPDGSALSDIPGPDGLDDLKTLAISRLMCTNIPHIKAFWIMQTPKLAQVSLNWGVDDIDGTVVYYDITKREGEGTTHQELSVDKLQRLIVEAGCIPTERDTVYRRVLRDANTWRIEDEAWSVEYKANAPSSTGINSNPTATGVVQLGLANS